ncbi:hypothetical protein [Methanopyrus kandleri]|uniref:hypothetical protein n=1 Tax=Methanopyrus kandleri TaxID=2320 RepID=UPI001D03CE46|nr:hypothetical protein [Methanopyrus kandleri]
MDVRSLYGLALDVTTLAVLELVKRYPASGEKLPEDRNSVELVLWEVKDLFRRFELGRLVDEEEFLEACFEVLRLPGVPVRVGGACEEAGLETLRNVFTDPDASVLFITSRGLDVFEDVMDGLGMDPKDVRAECRRLLVRDDGAVGEDAIESWVEAGFEVRVITDGESHLKVWLHGQRDGDHGREHDQRQS